MLQKTIIATLLALLSGMPLLKAQTLDTTSADTLISITDSLISEVIREIKKEINEEVTGLKVDIKDGTDNVEIEIIQRDTYRIINANPKPPSKKPDSIGAITAK
jgi:hypothetical protein